MSGVVAPNIDGLRLYRVELTQEIWVLAEDAWQAEHGAPRYARRDTGEPVAYAIEIEGIVVGDSMRGTLSHWGREGDPPTIGEALVRIGEGT